MSQRSGFFNLLRNLVLFFSGFGLWWKFILFDVFFHKSHIWEKSGSWDTDQNTLGQSDCRSFKSTIWKFIELQGNEKMIETYWGKRGQKWVWLLWSQDSKIGGMSRGKQWNKLIFGLFIQIYFKKLP